MPINVTVWVDKCMSKLIPGEQSESSRRWETWENAVLLAELLILSRESRMVAAGKMMLDNLSMAWG